LYADHCSILDPYSFSVLLPLFRIETTDRNILFSYNDSQLTEKLKLLTFRSMEGQR